MGKRRLALVIFAAAALWAGAAEPALPEVALPTVTLPSAPAARAETPVPESPLDTYAEAIPAAGALYAACASPLVAGYCPVDAGGAEVYAAWSAIYDGPLPESAPAPALPPGIRMVAELRTEAFAAFNLAFYAQQGYNACLVPVRIGDRPETLARLAQIVLAAGMEPWFAWAASRDAATPLFPDPMELEAQFAALAPLCRGFLPAWGRTAAHCVLQDSQYMEYVCACARDCNPDLCIVGEAYWGTTHANQPHNVREWQVARNRPRDASGTLIVGLGITPMPVEAGLKARFGQDMAAGPCLGHVVGPWPKYGREGTAFREALEAKQALERRFLAAGCAGTVTLHGDLSGDDDALERTDDIGLFPIFRDLCGEYPYPYEVPETQE